MPLTIPSHLLIPMTKAVSVLLLAFCSCRDSNNDSSPERPPAVVGDTDQANYFEDIDMYALKGIRPLKSISYPCVEIRTSDERRILIFHSNAKRRDSQEYIKVNDMWVARTQSKWDTTMAYSYHFIFPDKYIELNYSDTISHKLLDVSVIANNKEVIYKPGNAVRMEPELVNLESIMSKAECRYEIDVKSKDSVLEVSRKWIHKNGQIDLENTECFKAGKRSYFWWSYFSALLPVIPCSR